MQVMRGQEEVQAKKDWEASKEAGVDMGKEGVRWVRKDEMVQVGRMLSLGFFWNSLQLEPTLNFF